MMSDLSQHDSVASVGQRGSQRQESAEGDYFEAVQLKMKAVNGDRPRSRVAWGQWV